VKSEKQTQFKPNLVRRKRIAERVKLMQSLYLQRITKRNAAKGYEKTNPIQTQNKPNFRKAKMSLKSLAKKSFHFNKPKNFSGQSRMKWL